MPLRPQMTIATAEPEEGLSFIRQMGIGYVSLMLKPEELTLPFLTAQQERLAKHHLEISDVFCTPLQKNKKIHLGLPGRDEEIAKFNRMLEVLGKAGIPFTSIAWQPDGILRTDWRVGEHTRGGVSMYCDQGEVLSKPLSAQREYREEEIWDNFRYFMDRVLPTAEKYHVAMALHPNDPPLACMTGVPSLIWNTQCYEKAFACAQNSPMLGMKLCVGCWLEAGAAFGDLMADIEKYSALGKILCVHFRNVSAPLPVFEETLAEDGYGDMYAIMKQLVSCGCDAVISIDHAFRPLPGMGGMTGAAAYSTGYMKGLLDAARRELGKE